MRRRLSAVSTARAKHVLDHALDDLSTCAADPQRVYSSLIAIHGALVEHSHRDVLVDSVLSRADAVALLCELLRSYVAHEEIQWCLCRVLVLACSSSLRFQCQLGQRALWTDVYHVRSAHPSSMRVLETSLELYDALLRGNEFHAIKARPAQSLIQEMLAAIDRFSQRATNSSGGGSASRTRAYEAWRPEMVIRATRVLAAIYASPRIQVLAEERNEAFAHAIVTRLVTTLDVFVNCERDVRLWLQLARLQIQQHLRIAVPALLLLPVANASAVDAPMPWFARVLDTWRDAPAVVYDVAALFTLVFAIPHELREHLDALNRALLLGPHSLLSVLSELLALYDSRQLSDSAAAATMMMMSELHLQLAMHEIARVLRMWSAEPATCVSFDAMAPRASKALVSTLTVRLQHSVTQIQQSLDSTSSSSSHQQQRALEHALELLLVLQHLVSSSRLFTASSKSKSKNRPLGTQELTPVLQDLRQQLNALAAIGGTYDKRDTDLDALVRRALGALEKTLLRMPPSSTATPTHSLSASPAAALAPVGSSSKRTSPLLLPSPSASSIRTTTPTALATQQPNAQRLTKAPALRSPSRMSATAAVALRTSASLTRL